MAECRIELIHFFSKILDSTGICQYATVAYFIHYLSGNTILTCADCRDNNNE